MIKELWHRRHRTLTAILGLAVGMAVLITLNALSSAYTRAARMPLQEIGADITVQRAGDVPEDLMGICFPPGADGNDPSLGSPACRPFRRGKTTGGHCQGTGQQPQDRLCR